MRFRDASDPVWAIFFDPGSGRLYATKSLKLLLRPFRPGHKNEITPILDSLISKVGRDFSMITSRPFRLRHDMLARARSSGVWKTAWKSDPALGVISIQ